MLKVGLPLMQMGLPAGVLIEEPQAKVTIFSGGEHWQVEPALFFSCLQECVDRKTIIFFKLLETGAALDVDRRQDCLLDLLAGAEPELGVADQGEEDSDVEEAEVNVQEELLAFLRSEVENARKSASLLKHKAALARRPAGCRPAAAVLHRPASSSGYATIRRPASSVAHSPGFAVMDGGVRCLLCPFKIIASSSHHAKRDFLIHLDNHHGRHRQKQKAGDRMSGGGFYVASQAKKQLKLIKALFDHDRCVGAEPGHYLQRSATIIRETVRPALHTLKVDDEIRLLLDTTGPRFINAAAVRADCPDEERISARRVGYLYYTRAFAEMFFREALLHAGRARPIRARFLTRSLEAGSQATHLFPINVRTWLDIMEDVFSAPFLLEFRQKQMQELIDHDEFVHIAIDATVRVAMRVKGQANYRESAERRARISANLVALSFLACLRACRAAAPPPPDCL